MAVAFIDRVAAKSVDVRPLRVLLWVLAAPFWLAGATVGLVWVAAVWAWSAAAVGAGDVRARVTARSP